MSLIPAILINRSSSEYDIYELILYPDYNQKHLTIPEQTSIYLYYLIALITLLNEEQVNNSFVCFFIKWIARIFIIIFNFSQLKSIKRTGLKYNKNSTK